MTRRTLTRRVAALQPRTDTRLARFRPFARALLVFGGTVPTPERIDALAARYANGGRVVEH